MLKGQGHRKLVPWQTRKALKLMTDSPDIAMRHATRAARGAIRSGRANIGPECEARSQIPAEELLMADRSVQT